MLYDLYKKLAATRWFKPVMIIVLILFIVLIVFGVAILFAPHKKYELKNTHLNTSTSQVYLSGSTLYSYSSDSFTSYDIQKNTPPDILLTGVKLPAVKDVTWANKQGALITVQNMDDENIFGTAIQQYLAKNSANLNQLRNTTTWYIEFSTGDITPVSTAGTIFDNSIAYSETEKGFYFITNPASAPRIDNDVSFFSVETKKLSTRGTVSKYNTITSSSVCVNKTALCVIGYKAENPKKVQLSSFLFSSKAEKENTQATGVMTATNTENIFAVFNDTVNNSDNNEVDDFTFTEVTLFDVAQNKVIDSISIPETNQASSVLIDPNNPQTRIIIGVNNNYATYRSEVRTFLGFTAKRDVTIANAEEVQLTDVISSENSNSAVVADSNGAYQLITPRDTEQLFTVENDDKVSQTLTACESKVKAFNDYEVSESEIKIMSMGDVNTFAKSFKEIGACIKQSPSIFTGRAITYYGVSERTGRVVIE